MKYTNEPLNDNGSGLSMRNNEIRDICKRYGENVFRMALSHMVAVGTDRLQNINVDETVKEIHATGGNSLITPDMQAAILRCAYELAQKDLWDILAFVQTDIAIHGISIHPGVIVDFYDPWTETKCCTYVLPADTSEDLIEDVAEEIRKARPACCKSEQLADLIRTAFRKKGVRVENIGQDLGIEL